MSFGGEPKWAITPAGDTLARNQLDKPVSADLVKDTTDLSFLVETYICRSHLALGATIEIEPQTIPPAELGWVIILQQ